jgi:alpha-glucosidase (family GH31 glycosyl hydrolase)
MDPVKQHTEEKADAPLHLWVHPGADGAFSLYEDDGKTFDFRKGEFMRLALSWNDKRRRLNIRLAKGSKMLEPRKRNIVIHVSGESHTRDVIFEGRSLQVKV